jgi:hypothetical protein
VALLVVLPACVEPSRQEPRQATVTTAADTTTSTAPERPPLSNTGGWTAAPLSGIPADAQFWDVALWDGVFVATGQLPSAGDDDAMALWRSTDGLAWTEVHREPYLQNIDGAPSARVASGPRGFAVVGASCDGGRWSTPCRPLALTSADGRAWTEGDVRFRAGLRGATKARLLRGTPQYAYEGAAMLDVIDSGGWLAVGWIQAGSYDAEPAVWRARDAGATWEPIPAEGIPPGGSRADHMERVTTWRGRLLAMGFDQGQSGGTSPRLWASVGPNEWRSLSAPDVLYLDDMASLVSGEAFLAGLATGSDAAVWRSRKGGEWERSTDPALANLQVADVLESGPTGLVLLGAERGSDPNTSGTGGPAVWGSPDGVHWIQTLRLPAVWSATIPTKDRWFVYGTTGEGPERRHVVWTTMPRCATGAANCPAG